MQSILAQNFEKERFEIILVDDNSSDKSIETIKDFLKMEISNLLNLKMVLERKKLLKKELKRLQMKLLLQLMPIALIIEVG